ncbi:MAG: phosphoribosyltransferase family protein [Waddliaceae bacterium]
MCHRIAAVFDHAGPAATLVKKMEKGSQLDLAKGAAAFLALQLAGLGWPLPDVIVPVPISFVRWLQRGYNQRFLLAKSLGKLINRPVRRVLKRVSEEYRQEEGPCRQRFLLSPRSFRLTKRRDLQDQTLLLVDDVMTTGRTLRCCAETLLEGYPKRIYGLTLCRAMQ